MTKYDSDFKLRVVQVCLTGTDGGVKVIAAAFGVKASTVRRWVLAYADHGESALQKKFIQQH